MSTQEQIEANRRNGKLSKGPTTKEGKAISAKNARQHGLLSCEVLLPTEDAARFCEVAQRLREELGPQTELESMLVDRIIGTIWRLQRISKIEAEIFTWRILAEREQARANEQVRTGLDQLLPASASGQMTDQANQGAIDEERGLVDQRGTETVTLGLAFVRDGQQENAFSNLSRYEASIERSLYRAIHELQRLQAARQGHVVPPPQSIDLDVAGVPEVAFTERVLRIIDVDDSTEGT
jgi:hypothetical protein